MKYVIRRITHCIKRYFYFLRIKYSKTGTVLLLKGHRRTGKTVALTFLASKFKGVILCPNTSSKDEITDTSLHFKWAIKEPVIFNTEKSVFLDSNNDYLIAEKDKFNPDCIKIIKKLGLNIIAEEILISG